MSSSDEIRAITGSGVHWAMATNALLLPRSVVLLRRARVKVRDTIGRVMVAAIRFDLECFFNLRSDSP